MTRSRSPIALALLGLGLGLGLHLTGCFQAPADDVLFACEPDGASACPSGYTCEADGCCHKDGSDVDASFGACALGGETEGDFPGSTGDSSTGGTDTGDTDGGGTDTGGTDTGA